MKPVMQTDFGQFGNCFSACLASLFELPLEEVPNFFTVAGTYDDAAWWAAVRDWLRPRGYGIMFNDLRDPDHLKLFEGYFIVSGKSSRNVHHATIWKDGVMVHDPHQEQCGLVAPDGIDLIYPLDVSALAALSERGGEAVAIVGENQVLEWAPPYIRPPVGTKLYTRPQVGHLAPDSDPSSHRRCKCEFSGGGVLAKTCDFHRRLLAAQVSENAAQEGASSQLSNNGSSRRLGAETSEDAPPAAAPPAAGEVQELADRLEQYIPDGDGYNGEYAKTLTAAVAFLRGTSHE